MPVPLTPRAARHRASAAKRLPEMNIFTRLSPAALTGSGVLLASLLANVAVAQIYWDPTTNSATGTATVGTNGLGITTAVLVAGNWTTSAFWTTTPTSTVAGDYTVYPGGTPDVIFNAGILSVAGGAITLTAPVSVNSIGIQGGRWTFAGTSSLTIGAGGLSLAAAGGGNLSATVGGDTSFGSVPILLGASQTWTNNASGNSNHVTFSGTVSGTGATNQTLTLAGNVNGSGFKLTGVVADSAGGGKLGVTVNNLTTNGTNTAYQLNNAANTFTGKVAVASGGLAFNSIADAGVASSLGAASGSDSVIDLGAGTTTGGITLGATSSGTTVTSSSNRVINLAGTTGGGVIRNAVTSSSTTLTLSGGVTNAGGGNKSLTLSGTNIGLNTLSGVIADAADLSKTAVVKNEAGQWVLTAANTYTGGTTINAGTLALGTTGTLGQNIAGNNVTIAGGNLLLNADTNVGTNQTITITSAGGGIGVSYTPTSFPTIIDNSGATGGVFGLNYTGTGGLGVGGVAGINALFTSSTSWFLGSFTGGSGVYTGTSLTAGAGNNYRLGGGGGALTVQNDVLTGANNLIVGSTGGGSVTLSSANTFTGTTTVQNGTLNVSSLNSVSGGSATSSLGAPITSANGTITLGSTTNAVGLNYTGTGETTDRILRLNGTTGNVTLGNSGTGAVNYTSAPVFSGNGAKTLILGNTTDTVGGTIGAIANSSGVTSLTKAGLTNSNWTLTAGAANTYTGTTLVTGGVLQTASVSDLATSYVNLNGADVTRYAVWQTSGTNSRTLSSTAAAANMNWQANSGFAARGGALVLNFSSGATLSWGLNGFLGTGVSPMVFGSSTANNQVELKNNFTFGDNVSAGFNRVIHVEKGTGGDSALLSGVISVGGGTSSNNGFVKSGGGTLILSGNNTYTGSTTFANATSGILLINGAQTAATGSVTVSTGNTLGGSGTIGGATTVNTGGFLAPGGTEGGIAKLTFNSSLALNGTATLQVISAATRGVTYDAIDVAGALTGTGSLVINFSSFLGDSASLDLFNAALPALGSVVATGAYSGAFSFSSGIYTLVSGGQTLTLTASTGDLLVTGSAIPEPSTYAIIFGGTALIGSWFIRRRRTAFAK